MNFFKSLFGIKEKNSNPFAVKSDNTLAFEKTDAPHVFPAKLMLMVLTETGSESPKIDDINEILRTSFPECPQSEAFMLAVKLMAMHNVAGGSSQKWGDIFDNFLSQLQEYDLTTQKKIATETAATIFILKMQEGMENVAENYVYRLSKLEKYLSISKSEYIQILEDEKENTGYNEYKNNL